MARPLTEAALRKKLESLTKKIAAKGAGEQRLELLRRQAELGDQRDAAATKKRRSGGDSRP